VVVSDEAEIPAALRGYVQLALRPRHPQRLLHLQQGSNDSQPTLSAKVLPTKSLTRSFLPSPSITTDRRRGRQLTGRPLRWRRLPGRRHSFFGLRILSHKLL